MLVTGGSGYLGNWVVQLARQNWDVTATYLSHATDDPDVEWRRLDVRDEAAVRALMDEIRPATIIHTVARPGGADDFESINALGTRHVARAAAGVGARLVHISTDAVLDGQGGNYTEYVLPNPITPYGRSKAWAEDEVLASGVQAAIVRTSLIYGWRPTVARAAQWMIDALQVGEPLHLFTDEMRCPVWVESLAAAVVELAELTYSGVLNVAGAQALSRYEFGVRLLRFHGVDPTPVISIPSPKDKPRPLDCTLDCSRARALLQAPLPGVDEILAQNP
jgi:dTDP-4-dehydrorhamnose reductase